MAQDSVGHTLLTDSGKREGSKEQAGYSRTPRRRAEVARFAEVAHTLTLTVLNAASNSGRGFSAWIRSGDG